MKSIFRKYINLYYVSQFQSRSRQHSSKGLKRQTSEPSDQVSLQEHMQGSRNRPEPLVYDNVESESSESEKEDDGRQQGSSSDDIYESSTESDSSSCSSCSRSDGSRIAVLVEPSSPIAVNTKVKIKTPIRKKSKSSSFKTSTMFIPSLSKQRARPQYLQLFPDLPSSADEAFSMPDLPAMRGGARPKQLTLNNIDSNQKKKKKPLIWKTQLNESGNITLKFCDWRCLTKSKNRNHKKKLNSRSPSRSRKTRSKKRPTKSKTATSKKQRDNKKKLSTKSQSSRKIIEKPLNLLMSSEVVDEGKVQLGQKIPQQLHTIHVNPLTIDKVSSASGVSIWHGTSKKLLNNQASKQISTAQES